MSEREQIDQQVARAWLNHRSPLDVPEFERAMRRCLDALDAANARADEAEREVARLESSLREYDNAAQTAIALAIGRLNRHEPGAALTGLRCAVDRLAALTPEDIKCPDCEGRGWRPTGDGYGDEVCPTCAEDTQ